MLEFISTPVTPELYFLFKINLFLINETIKLKLQNKTEITPMWV